MMNGPEKSDSAIRAKKPANKAGHRLRSGWSKGRGPRGTRANRTRDGLRAAVACHRGWNVYGTLQGSGRRRSSPRCCTISRPICYGILDTHFEPTHLDDAVVIFERDPAGSPLEKTLAALYDQRLTQSW